MIFIIPSYCWSRKSWIWEVLYLLVSGADSEWERIKLTLALSLSTFAPLLDLNNLNALFQLGWTWNELLACLEYFEFTSHFNWSSNLRIERKHYMNVVSSKTDNLVNCHLKHLHDKETLLLLKLLCLLFKYLIIVANLLIFKCKISWPQIV